MVDRSLPLAERVRTACFRDWSVYVTGDDATAALADLLADIAAAGMLADAADALGLTDMVDYMRGAPEFLAALAAYRKRMEVGDA